MYEIRQAWVLGSPLFTILLFFIVIVLAFWAWPKYNVYKQELKGQAALKEAEWSKKIVIEEAKAREQTALMQAKAKITLAEAEGKGERIYIPTEAGLPILEAGK